MTTNYKASLIGMVETCNHLKNFGRLCDGCRTALLGRVNPQAFERLRVDASLLASRVEAFGQQLYAQPDIQAKPLPIKMTPNEMLREALPYLRELVMHGSQNEELTRLKDAIWWHLNHMG